MPKYYQGHPCPECGTLVKVSYGRYCPKHMRVVAGYGHPTARPVNHAEMEHYRGIVSRGLAARITSKPVKAALEMAGALLDYVPPRGYTRERVMQQQMQRLKDNGVTPYDFLLETCAVFAMEYLDERRFPVSRSVDYTAARQVLKLSNQGRFRPNATILSHLGGELRDYLAVFAYGLVKEAIKVDTKQNDLREAMLQGWGSG